MVGRGTRLHPGKTDVCVIDIVDNSEAHALAGLNRLFELPDSMDLRGHDVLKTLQRAREIGHRYPWVDVNGVSRAGDLDFVMERVDLFRCEPPPEVSAISEFVWMPLPGEGSPLLLSEKRQFVAARNLLGRWKLRFIAGRDEPATLVAVSDELAKVVRHAEQWVQENAPDSVKIAWVVHITRSAVAR